ncbi:Vacuolar cation/proton exchanger 3 [Camellia lanceoleosa]|uniref:Vacuolar cation/proton exchanger 3 n=1 Tax=Camellia lanceoleosa TaxID=1840588 RepID=A0ACC0GEW9_9ERIC|nr:Vacuolar cation/proton exchanger 3 [Camellia lanceoleosa]
MALTEPWIMENGDIKGLSKELRPGRTAHNMSSSSSLRKKSDLSLVSKVPCGIVRLCLANLQEVILGTKLSVLFPAIPLAVVAECYGFGRAKTSICEFAAVVAGSSVPHAALDVRYARKLEAETAKPTIELSRVSSIVMLLVYFAYLVFQLWTHRQMFEAKEVKLIILETLFGNS